MKISKVEYDLIKQKNLQGRYVTQNHISGILKELSNKSHGIIASIFAEGIRERKYIDHNPTVIADIFWALFSGTVLWEASKKIINKDKDYLKPTLKIAFEIFNRGLKK